jgi:predicted nucleic-acid-binding Zn-ribbon protein
MASPPTMPQIPATPDKIERMKQALDRLRARGALRDTRCPSCGTDNWNVDFIAIPSTPLPGAPTAFGPAGSHVVFTLAPGSTSAYIPALTLVCTNCGYTKIYNLNILGLWGG